MFNLKNEGGGVLFLSLILCVSAQDAITVHQTKAQQIRLIVFYFIPSPAIYIVNLNNGKQKSLMCTGCTCCCCFKNIFISIPNRFSPPMLELRFNMAVVSYLLGFLGSSVATPTTGINSIKI